jgi:trehalose/maltose transport system permease protein
MGGAEQGFWRTDWGMAIRNTFQFAAVSVVLETVLGVVFALVLNANFKGRALVRAAVLVPWAIPTIVSAKMWAWIMHDQFGVLNAILKSWGLIDTNIAWTADPAYALWSVVLVDVWKTTPFMALLTLAALQMLPRDCYEAAHVDGIHPIKVFFKVTLPLIWPALMVAVIFRLLDALRVFDIIYVMTSNSVDTISMSGFVRREIVDNNYVGYGSAASTVLFLIIAGCTLLYLKLSRVDLGGKK